MVLLVTLDQDFKEYELTIASFMENTSKIAMKAKDLIERWKPQDWLYAKTKSLFDHCVEYGYNVVVWKTNAKNDIDTMQIFCHYWFARGSYINLLNENIINSFNANGGAAIESNRTAPDTGVAHRLFDWKVSRALAVQKNDSSDSDDNSVSKPGGSETGSESGTSDISGKESERSSAGSSGNDQSDLIKKLATMVAVPDKEDPQGGYYIVGIILVTADRVQRPMTFDEMAAIAPSTPRPSKSE